MGMTSTLSSIEEAIKDIQAGKLIIVVDDENRENEGDFICAAEKITPELVNFMTKHGRGLVCVPLTGQRCDELELTMMVSKNTVLHHTPFTVSVDLLGNGCTTGISAFDRSKTIFALTDENTKPEELGRPGHIFPLRARDGGVLERTGHTEAAVDLARLAGLKPAGVLVEILNEDGTMARLPQLEIIAEEWGLKIISIADLIAYRKANETSNEKHVETSTPSLVDEVVDVQLPTSIGNFRLYAYREKFSGKEHLALVKGEWTEDESILVRVHSSCMTGDIFGSCRCDCGPQLHQAMKQIEKEGKGVIVYMNQEGRGIGLLNKLKAYKLQEEGYDTVEANIKLGFHADERNYEMTAQILNVLHVHKLKLMTNNPDKEKSLISFGFEITEHIPIEVGHNHFNEKYLETKRDKMGHTLHLDTICNND